MPKSNIRETGANKLQTMHLLCDLILKEKDVPIKLKLLAERAQKDIEDMIKFLDKRKFSTH